MTLNMDIIMKGTAMYMRITEMALHRVKYAQ